MIWQMGQPGSQEGNERRYALVTRSAVKYIKQKYSGKVVVVYMVNIS